MTAKEKRHAYYLAHKARWLDYRYDWVAKNPERANEIARQCYHRNKHKLTAEDKEKRRQYLKQYNIDNKDRLAKWKAAYHQKHKAKHREQGRRWASNNREKIRVAGRAYALKTKARKSEVNKVWKKKNADKVLEYSHRRRTKMYNGTVDGTALAFIKFVRSKESIPCYYCGKVISGKRAHIDHVIAVARQGNHSSQNLCASCSDCNFRKNDKLPSEIHFLPQPLLNL